MAIEFRCTQCSKLLRTGDETAGRQAKCPDCGAVMTIPAAAAPAGGSAPPPLSPAGDSPFAAGSPQPPQFAPPGAVYETPGWAGQGASAAAQRVSAPATALIVTAWIGIVLQALGILAILFGIGLGAGAGAVRGQNPAILSMMSGGIGVLIRVIQLAMGVVVLIGAGKMKNLESYGFAMTATIIAMVPCTSPCCLLGLPFGIWALVVLCDSSVKAAFRS